MDLYTNRSSQHDFIHNAFFQHTKNDMDIFIASAFFTESDVIDELIQKNCHIRIIVRLGFPTSPLALEKILKHPNIEARYFNSHSFHPKLYIFGDQLLLVGSANLTKAALLSNQEIMVSITSDDERFEKLQTLFSEYWDQAAVLNDEALKLYRLSYNKFANANKLIEDMEDEISKNMGEINFSNINRGKKISDKKSIFLDTYQKSYQTCLYAFRLIENEYKTFDRKVDENSVPLRVEIDSFISFVRERHATNDSWKHQPIGWTESQKINLRTLIEEWLNTPWFHFEEWIVPRNYPLITKTFNSPESIEACTIDEIVEALCVLHSFENRRRFYAGGLETLKSQFISSNDSNKVKKTLTYLLYGNGNLITRMANCIFDNEYKLNEFGQANVQELIGWVNKENFPVINGRTTKVLRYFGNEVHQLS